MEHRKKIKQYKKVAQSSSESSAHNAKENVL